MRTLTLRKTSWDDTLAVFVDNWDKAKTNKYGGSITTSPISSASIARIHRLIDGKMPSAVQFGPLGLIVRYDFEDK